MDKKPFNSRLHVVKFASSKEKSSRYSVGRATRRNLTSSERFQRFKKLEEKHAKKGIPIKSSVKNRRVTFLVDMEVEEAVVNGSNDPEIDTTEEKILKPRKPVPSHEESKEEIFHNGNEEKNGLPDSVENDNVENGYDEELAVNDTSKQNKKSLRQQHLHEKKESSPKKKDAKPVKESTPKPDTPPKRELRRRETTPKELTPKPETPTKQNVKRRGTPVKKVIPPEKNPESSENKEFTEENEHVQKHDASDSFRGFVTRSCEKINKETEEKLEETVTEKIQSEDLTVTIDDREEETVEERKKTSIFSVFHKSSSSNSSVEIKDTCEASSSSQSFNNSPFVNRDKFVLPDKEIRGRQPIDSFSRFPGRNVSVTSLESPLKRKADDSLDENEMKRFAGETESGSEKSPGWHFFNKSFQRVWTPAEKKPKSFISSSTPFNKKNEQDSMAVNYNEESKLSLEDTMSMQVAVIDDQSSPSVKTQNGKWCTIM